MDFLNVVRCCTPALPSAYADALSYYDALCKLQGAINEVIATLNTYTPVTEEWVKNYVIRTTNFDKQKKLMNLNVQLTAK